MAAHGCIFGLVIFSLTTFDLTNCLSVLTQPQNISLRAGETGELACKFDGPAPTCVWHKDTDQVGITGRYQMLGSLDDGDCSIQIQQSNIDFDDGMWICGIPGDSQQHAIYSDKAKYTVYSMPADPVIYKDGQALVNGSILTRSDSQYAPQIICRSEGGNPPPTLAFSFANAYDTIPSNTTVANGTQSKAYITTATMLKQLDTSFDGQLLTCSLTHPALDGQMSTFVAVRKETPVANVRATNVAVGSSSTSTSFLAASGSTVYLKCTADGAPMPTFSWDKRTSSSAPWTTFRSNSASINFTVEQGDYSCQAWNDDAGYNKIRSSNVITFTLTGGSSGMTTSINGFIFVGTLLLGLFWTQRQNSLKS